MVFARVYWCRGWRFVILTPTHLNRTVKSAVGVH